MILMKKDKKRTKIFQMGIAFVEKVCYNMYVKQRTSLCKR